ncbi:hypothetical protein [Variovorax boronicumulans]|nr:hypothetical protein [Variovorax boronicumulans]
MTHRAGLLFAVELMGRIVVERRAPRFGRKNVASFTLAAEGAVAF